MIDNSFRDQKLVIENVTEIKQEIYEMTLAGDCRGIGNPGRFINIKLDGFYLRRPISIADFDDRRLTVIFKTVGHGTFALSRYNAGKELEVLMPLGNGFQVKEDMGRPVVIGGGIGIPPLYGLAKEMVAKGISPRILLGFNGEEDVILIEEFKALGLSPEIATVDGSVGIKGLVTNLMNDREAYVYACGPEPMLKSVYERCEDGQFSFEARMACGFGACMGCSCETKYGYKRICKDGPILMREEIKW